MINELYEISNSSGAVIMAVSESTTSTIMLDTCASHKLIIVKERELIDNFIEATAELGTADRTFTLKVKGYGFISGNRCHFCPEARCNLVSSSVTRSHGLTYVDSVGVPTLMDTELKTTILTGRYINGMPSFDALEFF